MEGYPECWGRCYNIRDLRPLSLNMVIFRSRRTVHPSRADDSGRGGLAEAKMAPATASPLRRCDCKGPVCSSCEGFSHELCATFAIEGKSTLCNLCMQLQCGEANRCDVYSGRQDGL